MGVLRRPPGWVLARARAASITATVSAVTMGEADPRPSWLRQYRVPVPATNSSGRNCLSHGLGVTQAMARELSMKLMIVDADPYTPLRVSATRFRVPWRVSAIICSPASRSRRTGSSSCWSLSHPCSWVIGRPARAAASSRAATRSRAAESK